MLIAEEATIRGRFSTEFEYINWAGIIKLIVSTVPFGLRFD